MLNMSREGRLQARSHCHHVGYICGRGGNIDKISQEHARDDFVRSEGAGVFGPLHFGVRPMLLYYARIQLIRPLILTLLNTGTPLSRQGSGRSGPHFLKAVGTWP